MTDFKKGDRVLVPCVVKDVYAGDDTVKVRTLDNPISFFQEASAVRLASEQPLKEGDQVATLAGSLGFIRAIYKDEAYVILLDNPTRSSITCDLSHLRRAERVDVEV